LTETGLLIDIERQVKTKELQLFLEGQGVLLLRTYDLELARDPDSHATASVRSNLIALLHTTTQIYGKSAPPRR
jgi:hypothetical protein